MIKIIAKKDFTRNGEPIFNGDDVKVNSVEVKQNKVSDHYPLILDFEIID